MNQRITRHITLTARRQLWISLFTIGLLWLSAALTVQAQDDQQIRIAVREDAQSVYVYHTELPPLGHGFNIYRKGVDETEFTRLNPDPIRGVISGGELRAFLGTQYDEVEQVTRQANADEALTRWRSDELAANLLTFTHPSFAEALGRLYIDTTAPLETAVTYRIEFVDAIDRPTGKILEETVLLLPQKPGIPTGLRADTNGKSITLFWQYQPPNFVDDDKVIRFEAFRIDPGTNQPQRVHIQRILRNNAVFEYTVNFEVPTTGQTEQLFVRAVDITGVSGPDSEILRVLVEDDSTPEPPTSVQARPLSANRVAVEWPAAQSADFGGYHVYRSAQVDNLEAYARLTDSPLSGASTSFVDSLQSIPGGQAIFYRLSTITNAGVESALSHPVMILAEDRMPPPTPNAPSASFLEDGTINLTWRSPADTSDVAGYILLRQRLGKSGPGLASRVNQTLLSGTDYIDLGEAQEGFWEGATYQYSVMSVDKAGNQSQPATTTFRVPNLTPPASPNGMQASIENSAGILLTWNASPSLDVMSYIVYRQQPGATTLDAFPVPANQRRLRDQGVTPGNEYIYWVTAADSAGNESARSAPDRITMRDFMPPRRVRNIHATLADSSGVALAWEPVSSDDLAGYRVYRAPTETGGFTLATSELVASPSWVDPEGETGVWYQVRAVDTSGNESKPSAPTCALTPRKP